MVKYLLIQTCRECAFVEHWEKDCYCNELRRKVDPDTIDPDCELPNYLP